MATIAQRVSRLRRTSRWAATKPPVAKRPEAAAWLRAGGIDFAATVASELELNGYVIERVCKADATTRRSRTTCAPSQTFSTFASSGR
jgi:hypothetical protein